MKHMKIGVVLLALLLAGMAMVPMVSAMNDDRLSMDKTNEINRNAISKETAKIHAEYALAEFISLGALGDKSTWSGTVINPEPLEIYDITGEKLCYLFNIEKNNTKVGEIRIASSKVTGASVLYIGP